jgi:hypothetical protein
MLDSLFDSGKLAKMTIQAFLPANPDGTMDLSEAEEDKYTVLVNPESYSVSYRVNYERAPAIGNTSSEAKYANTSPPTLNFEFLFDGTGVIPMSSGPLDGVPIAGAIAGAITDLLDGEEDDVMAQLRKFIRVMEYSGEEHQPRVIQLSWGKLLFVGVMSELTVDYKLFKPDGTPLRAIAKAAFDGTIDDKLREQVEGNSSPDLTHSRTVTEGDKLPLMTQKIYRSPHHYIGVAKANKLYNFRNLRAGSQLDFPPIDKSTV